MLCRTQIDSLINYYTHYTIPVIALASHYGISSHTVYKILHDNNVPIDRKETHTNKNICVKVFIKYTLQRRCRAMLHEGFTLDEIADALRIRTSDVVGYLSYDDICEYISQYDLVQLDTKDTIKNILDKRYLFEGENSGS